MGKRVVEELRVVTSGQIACKDDLLFSLFLLSSPSSFPLLPHILLLCPLFTNLMSALAGYLMLH